MKTAQVSFTLFEELANRLTEEVRRRGVSYDGILCPLRGGFYLSDFMSRHLGIAIRYLEISSYSGRAQMDFRIGGIPELPSGRYLLCDDIYDTGATVRKICELFPQVRFDTVCLVTKDPSAPVVSGMRVEADTWVVFYWETWEETGG